MTASLETIPYFDGRPDSCPLCHKRQVGKKKIYGHPVCKKCFYAFANRRQLAYVVDGFIVVVPNIFFNLVIVRYLQTLGLGGLGLQLAASVTGIPLFLLFIMKDGFTGQSPGKRLLGVQVLDDPTGQPISFAQSFKRNLILLLGLIPLLGSLISVIIIIIIAMQVARGCRLGDRFAKTRVIWKKYAHLAVFGGDALICEKCGYDLTGNLSGQCPECGTPLSDENLRKTRESISAV